MLSNLVFLKKLICPPNAISHEACGICPSQFRLPPRELSLGLSKAVFPHPPGCAVRDVLSGVRRILSPPTMSTVFVTINAKSLLHQRSRLSPPPGCLVHQDVRAGG